MMLLMMMLWHNCWRSSFLKHRNHQDAVLSLADQEVIFSDESSSVLLLSALSITMYNVLLLLLFILKADARVTSQEALQCVHIG